MKLLAEQPDTRLVDEQLAEQSGQFGVLLLEEQWHLPSATPAHVVVAVADTIASRYILVDDISGVAERRSSVREKSKTVLKSRRSNDGGRARATELLPIDALSTADQVIAAEQLYGFDSAERAERWSGLVLDCNRMLAEWYRKLRPEYFDALRHTWNQASESFFSHGFSTRQMTENALVPMPDDAEDEGRRVNERVEDATLPIMRGLGAIAVGQSVLTVSLCPDKAITDYNADVRERRRHRGYKGYVPEIAKAVFRKMWLEELTGDRFEEQLAVPGEYFTPEIMQLALLRRDVDVSGMDKTELQGAQMLTDEDLVTGFMPLLDEIAGKEWCVNLFMGEVVPKDFVKDYAGFRDEARRRQEGLGDMAITVATFVRDLAEDGVDRRDALEVVEDFVKKLLLELGKKDLVVAEQMFDKQTAAGLREVARLEDVGLYEEAFALQQVVEQNAPGGGFCGAGSCGLESVNVHSAEGRKLSKDLHAKPGDTILRDKIRKCSCGSRNVAYAYIGTRVNKKCTKCGAFESKISGIKVA